MLKSKSNNSSFVVIFIAANVIDARWFVRITVFLDEMLNDWLAGEAASPERDGGPLYVPTNLS